MKENLKAELEVATPIKARKSRIAITLPEENNQEKKSGGTPGRGDGKLLENMREKEEMTEISKEIKIEISMIMIENCKVEMKGNLHYNPNGLNVENGIKVSETIFGKVESDCDKGRNLHIEKT